jgi:DNA-binding transcriptional LysR family regulator
LRPDFVSLALFVRIAELKSITRAAEASHIALAAASRRLALLETQLGVPLFTRTARGVELTQAGTVTLHHARLLLNQVEQLQAELADHVNGSKGLVRIQANTTALAQFLSEDLAAFSRLHPDARLSLSQERSVVIAQSLLAGTTDIGIVVEGSPTEGLTRYDYRTDQLVAVVPRTHALRGRQVAFVDLLDHDIVGLEGDSALTQLLIGRATLLGKPLRLRVQVKSFDVVARMISAGFGVGVLPRTAAESYADALKLRLMTLREDWATRRMYLVVRDPDRLPTIAQRLVRYLLDAPPAG